MLDNLRRRRAWIVALLTLAMSGVQSVAPTPVRATGGTISGTITLNGQPAPAGSYHVAAIRYTYSALANPPSPRCTGLPIGLAIVDVVREGGTYSITVPENSGYKIIFKPLASAPKAALQRWYSSLTAAGTNQVFSGNPTTINETCINVNNNSHSNINLVTSSLSDSVMMSGNLFAHNGEPMNAADVVVSKTRESMYWLKGDGYTTRLTPDGSWEIAGIDPAQTVYLQVHSPMRSQSMFCAVRNGSEWSMVAATSLTCPTEAAIQLGSIDITDVRLRLPQTGTIRGTISGPNGPVGSQQVCVDVYRTDGSANNYFGSLASRGCTTETGTYEIGVPFSSSTNYKLSFVAQHQSGLSSKWHDNVAASIGYAGATNVPVQNSTPVVVNATLDGLKFIAGRITNAQGVGVAGASVAAEKQHATFGYRLKVSTAVSDSSGNYKLYVPEDGTYAISASHSDYSPMYLGQSENFDNATMVVVDSSSSSVNVDPISLSSGLALSGALITSDNQSASACISAFKVDDDNLSSWGEFMSGNCFSSPGDWRIGGLRPGKYRLRVTNNQGYRDGFVGGPSLDAATVYTVLNSNRNDIDVTLSRGKTISGKIRGSSGTGESGICVNAGKVNQWNSIEWLRWSCTNTSGDYSLSGLEGGRYVLQIQPPSSSDYGRGFASSTGFLTNNQNDALVVDISGGDTSFTAKEQMMSSAPKISGTVRDSSGPVANVCLTAYLKTDNFGMGNWTGSGCSASNGVTTIAGLVPGEYRIRVEPRTGLHQAGWHKSSQAVVASWSDATVVTVAVGADVVQLNNVTIAQGGAVTGTLMNGTTPVTDACVTSFKAVNGAPSEWIGQSCASQTGKFAITGLDRGASYLFRVDSFGGRLRSGFIDDARNVVDGFSNISPRSVASDLDLGNVSVSTAPTISGTVFSGGQSSEPNVCVTAHDAATLNWVATSCSSSSGKYTLRGLTANGQYKLSWWSGRPLIGPGWYSSTAQDAVSPAHAEIISISGSSDRSLNIRVPNAGSITGTITSAGLCVAAWTVSKSDFDAQNGERDNASAIACSNQRGEFTLRGLRPNVNYYLQAFSPTGAAVTQNSPTGDTAIQTGSAPIQIAVS